MSDDQADRFDGIAVMRAIRDRMNEELVDMTAVEVREWLDSYEYKSPAIRRFVEYHKSEAQGNDHTSTSPA